MMILLFFCCSRCFCLFRKGEPILLLCTNYKWNAYHIQICMFSIMVSVFMYMHILYTTNKMTSCKSDSSYNPFASMMYLVYKPPTSTDISALAPLWYGSLNNLIEWVQFHYNRNHERTEMNTFNMKLSQLITAKSVDIKIFIPGPGRVA